VNVSSSLNSPAEYGVPSGPCMPMHAKPKSKTMMVTLISGSQIPIRGITARTGVDYVKAVWGPWPATYACRAGAHTISTTLYRIQHHIVWTAYLQAAPIQGVPPPFSSARFGPCFGCERGFTFACPYTSVLPRFRTCSLGSGPCRPLDQIVTSIAM
jgi:hypothetical protein